MINVLHVKILKEFGGDPVGAIVRVTCDSTGAPLDYHWRRRVIDARLDKCCKIVRKTYVKGAT